MGEDRGSTGVRTPILFWLMFAVVLVPTGIFIWLSYIQLGNNLTQIVETIPSETKTLLERASGLTDLPDENARAEFLAKARVSLERDVVLYRHSRSSSALLTRTWMRFMSLIFGSILVFIGSAFVLAQIDVPKTSGRLNWREIGVSLQSGSAGIILVVIGSVLISIPNVSKQSIEIDDTSTYIAKTAEGYQVEEDPWEKPDMPNLPQSEDSSGGES